METVRFFVGMGYDKDNQPVTKAGEKLRECAEYLSALFGGCTVLDGSGYWKDERGMLIREPAIDFEIVTDKEHLLIEAATTLKRVFNQSAVLMTKQKVESAMV
jgi:hypothetical protein